MDEASTETNHLSIQSEPVRILFMLIASIFLVEFGIMFLLRQFYLPSFLLESLLDAGLLVVVIYPVMYYLVFRPLVRKNQEERETRKNLLKREVLFSTLAQTSPDCIKLFDVAGNIVFMNNEGLREHQYAALEDARKARYTDTMAPESQAAFTNAFAAALKGERSVLEIHHTKEGSNREYCLESLTPIRDATDAVSSIMGVSHNITQRKTMERELREKVDELEHANRLMIGRELKMVELKNELEALKKAAAR